VYEKMILATGSLPIIPPIPGVDLENVFVAKKDVEYLSGMLKTIEASKRVVIIGGGFIGMEFADDLTKRGLDITVVEMLPHCLQLNFDDEFCEKVEEKLKEKGVKLLTDTTAEEIGGEKKVEYVKLKGGEKLDADVVILGIGTRSNIEIGEKAGLKIGDTRAVWVDDFQRTSDPDIFAVGDCAEKRFSLTGTPAPLLLSSIAGMEAKIAGANLFGLKYKNDGAVGAFSTIMGDTAFGAAGLTERSAKDAGIEYVKVLQLVNLPILLLR
jgi:NAD(P)H-nitrite reductase large subunit